MRNIAPSSKTISGRPPEWHHAVAQRDIKLASVVAAMQALSRGDRAVVALPRERALGWPGRWRAEASTAAPSSSEDKGADSAAGDAI